MIAVDTEATYSKDRSIGPLGVHGYVSHPETDHFMCSIYDGDTGLAFVGHPKDAPWEAIRGQDVCAHNYSYDRAVLREYERRGYIPFALEERGFCTSNLVAYLQSPRSLLDSSRELLGIGLDKTTRDKFKNKDYYSLPDEVKEEIARYALGDAKACWLLWKQFAHLMPDHEKWLSMHTTLMGDRGVAVNTAAVESGIDRYKTRLWEIEQEIPWAKEHPVTSPIQLKNACRAAGIPVPDSTAMKDELFQAWSKKYAEAVPFVAAVQKYRSVNRSLKVLESIQTRTHGGRVRYGLKYFGANHTGRWSGDSGLNMQNLPRDEVDGVNIRNCFVAGPGRKLFIADYSQIEARVSLWLCGDHEQLELVRNGMCVYEAHARKTMGYDLGMPLKQAAKEDPKFFDLRQYAKARCLSGDTLVLTHRGYVPISKVKLDDRLWDGVEWVNHGGVIQSGHKQTVAFHGDRFTPEHQLFTDDSQTEATSDVLRSGSPAVDRFRERVSSWSDVWALAIAIQRVYSRTWIQAASLSLHFLRDRARRVFRYAQKRYINSVRTVRYSQVTSDTGLTKVGESSG
jgi:hypothetical protein